jgi:hypothetical protein
MSPMARIYTSRSFSSRVEADAHLEREVRIAALRHPDAGFYRYRELAYVENGIVQDEPLTVYECYDDDGWTQTEVPSGERHCESCVFRTDEPICPKCGGLTR